MTRLLVSTVSVPPKIDYIFTQSQFLMWSLVFTLLYCHLKICESDKISLDNRIGNFRLFCFQHLSYCLPAWLQGVVKKPTVRLPLPGQ